MSTCDMAKRNYDRGLWTKEMISALVVKAKLTAAEYEQIVGEPYAA